MKIRAIALAIPLAAFGFACKTSSTQGSSGKTASTSSGEYGGAQAGAQAGSSGASASGSVSGPSAQDQGTSPGATAQGDVKGHSDDQVVSGKLSKVSSDSVTITANDGTETMLHVVPQTSVTVDGRDAQAGDLQEGQPVRASFNDVEGQPTAVQIQVGQGASGSSGSSGSTGTGTMSDPGTYAPDPNAPNAPGAAGTPEGGAGSRSGSNPAQESTPPITEKRR